MANQDYEELFNLSLAAFKSLRRNFPAKVRWPQELEEWASFLKSKVGATEWARVDYAPPIYLLKGKRLTWQK